MVDTSPGSADLPSTAILFSDNAGLVSAIVSALTPHGWGTTATVDPAAALAALTADAALVVLDAHHAGAADLLQRLRAAPQPTGGVPVLQHGGVRLDGTSALLPPPGDRAALIAAIESFTGALGDHNLRRPPLSPFYRLVRLLGTRDAAGMIARFAETLRTALAEETASSEQAHRIAGLAGALGYTDLSLAWRAAEYGDTAPAMATTRATLAAIARDNLGPYHLVETGVSG